MEWRGRSMSKLPAQARVCTTRYFLPGYRSWELRPTGGPSLIAAVSYWVYRGQWFSLDRLTGPWSKGVLALAFIIDHSASTCFRTGQRTDLVQLYRYLPRCWILGMG